MFQVPKAQRVRDISFIAQRAVNRPRAFVNRRFTERVM